MVNLRIRKSNILEAPCETDYSRVRKGTFVELQLNLHWISIAFVFTYWSETE